MVFLDTTGIEKRRAEIEKLVGSEEITLEVWAAAQEGDAAQQGMRLLQGVPDDINELLSEIKRLRAVVTKYDVALRDVGRMCTEQDKLHAALHDLSMPPRKVVGDPAARAGRALENILIARLAYDNAIMGVAQEEGGE